MYWPGSASGNGSPSGRCIVSDTTSADSRSIAVTFSGRNPGAAGCPADAGASPALPSDRLCSNLMNDDRQPGESAAICDARSSRSRGC